MSKYLYCIDEWNEKFADEFETNCSYREAAEIICQEYDDMAASYPDERVIWLKKVTDDVPIKYIVYAENTRSYMAKVIEVKETAE